MTIGRLAGVRGAVLATGGALEDRGTALPAVPGVGGVLRLMSGIVGGGSSSRSLAHHVKSVGSGLAAGAVGFSAVFRRNSLGGSVGSLGASCGGGMAGGFACGSVAGRCSL